MSIYQSLRRVPHLVVSWAHHQFLSSGQESHYASPVTSPNGHSTSFRGYRQSRSFVNPPGEFQRFGEHRGQQMFGRVPSSPGLRLSMSVSANEALHSPIFRNWAPTYSSPQLHDCAQGGGDKQDSATTDATLVPDWSDDFPPLRDMEWTSPGAGKRDLMLPWSSRDVCDHLHEGEQKASASPSSSLAVQPATPVSAEMMEFFNNVSLKFLDLTVPASNSMLPADQPATEQSVASATPATPKSASLPQTPQTTILSLPGGDGPATQTTPKKGSRFSHRGDLSRDVPEFDPMAIWVGALDTSKWEETRVRTVFERYGQIERIDFHMRGLFAL